MYERTMVDEICIWSSNLLPFEDGGIGEKGIY
jgi:hypothetical protein